MKLNVILWLVLGHEVASIVMKTEKGTDLPDQPGPNNRKLFPTPISYMFISGVLGFLTGFILTFSLVMAIGGGFSDLVGMSAAKKKEKVRHLLKRKLVERISSHVRPFLAKSQKNPLKVIFKRKLWNTIAGDSDLKRFLSVFDSKARISDKLSSRFSEAFQPPEVKNPPRRLNCFSWVPPSIQNIGSTLSFECEGRFCKPAFKFFVYVGIFVGLVVAIIQISMNKINYSAIRRKS